MDAMTGLKNLSGVISKYKFVLLVVIIGIVFMTLPDQSQTENEPVVQAVTLPQISVTDELSQILGQIQGVGKVKVMITEQTGAETVYQVDEDRAENTDSNSVRQETVIISGNGTESGLVRTVTPPTYLGAIIVCQGADSPSVRLAVANAVFFILPIFTDMLFYDTWVWWAIAQSVINVVLMVCLVKEFFISRTKMRWIYIGAFLPLIAFGVDAVGIWLGAWKGAIASQYLFLVLLVIAVVMVLRLIPQNINAAAKAKELEMERIALNAELTESRMSTMMSQIRPHFIYNTLGTIEQLCDLDPKKAGELVHDFAKYLRGNFGELDNPKPILMSQEMEHVRHYVSIENVRFPDMTFTFEMNSDDFKIPALTVQPIVENAIKHGLMKLQKGGTINVVSYETETDYCISVVDDGVGFDMNAPLDEERKHVGLRNIRERLKAMVGGSLEIESAVGEGTRVLIKIPKEAQK